MDQDEAGQGDQGWIMKGSKSCSNALGTWWILSKVMLSFRKITLTQSGDWTGGNKRAGPSLPDSSL